MPSFTIATSGQTLIFTTVADLVSGTPVIYSDSGYSSAVTLPVVLTSDTTYYLREAGAKVTVTQQDGSALSSAVSVFDGGTVTPLASQLRTSITASLAPSSLGGHLQTGNYYFTTPPSAINGSATLGVGTLRLAPWFVPNSVTITKIGGDVAIVGDSGSLFRIGIYADDGSGYPGALVLDAGTILGDSQSVQDITVSQALTPGLYWIGGAVQNTTGQPNIRVSTVAPLMVNYRLLTTKPTAGLTVAGYSQASVTDVLPTTFTSTVTMIAVGAIPRIHVKV